VATETAVQDLVRAAKAAYSNPFDYLTSQAVTNGTHAVADAIKVVVQVAEPLKHMVAPPSVMPLATTPTQ
jgi:hypothetical protein